MERFPFNAIFTMWSVSSATVDPSQAAVSSSVASGYGPPSSAVVPLAAAAAQCASWARRMPTRRSARREGNVSAPSRLGMARACMDGLFPPVAADPVASGTG